MIKTKIQYRYAYCIGTSPVGFNVNLDRLGYTPFFIDIDD